MFYDMFFESSNSDLRPFSYTIDKIGRKWIQAHVTDKPNWKAKILINDISKEWKVGEIVNFLGTMEIKSSRYGRIVEVIPVEKNQEKVKKLKLERKAQGLLNYLRKAANNGKFPYDKKKEFLGLPKEIKDNFKDEYDEIYKIFVKERMGNILSWISENNFSLSQKYQDEFESLAKKFIDDDNEVKKMYDTYNHIKYTSPVKKMLKKIKERLEDDRDWYLDSKYYYNDLEKTEILLDKLKKYSNELYKEYNFQLKELKELHDEIIKKQKEEEKEKNIREMFIFGYGIPVEPKLKDYKGKYIKVKNEYFKVLDVYNIHPLDVEDELLWGMRGEGAKWKGTAKVQKVSKEEIKNIECGISKNSKCIDIEELGDFGRNPPNLLNFGRDNMTPIF